MFFKSAHNEVGVLWVRAAPLNQSEAARSIICMQNSLVPLKQQIMYLVFCAAALALLPEPFLTTTMNSLLPLFEQRKLLWV